MKGKEFTKEEMEKLKDKEKGFPVKQKWYKHKDKEVYKYQLSVLNGDFDSYKEFEQ
jgi:hypothetical protein|tara:strand:+ start:715 stop:882 length:168 start_codon:yes stop_codon:yes gene_type:complete